MRNKLIWMSWLMLSVGGVTSCLGAQVMDARAASGGSMAGTLRSPFMMPIYLASVLLVAVILERARALRSARLINREVLERALTLIRTGDVRGASQKLQNCPTAISQAWHHGIEEHLHSGEDLKETLSRVCLAEFKSLMRRLQIIATLGVVSPLFGLLGTVIGMIICFMQISIAGGADKARLAEGIGFALFTTAGGLLVAIPAILSNRWFQFHLLGLSDRVEDLIHQASVPAAQGVAQAPSNAHQVKPGELA